MKHLFAASLAVLASACTTVADVPKAAVASADLKLASGASVGKALLTASGDGLTLSLAAYGMPAGTHGAHLHMVGSCVGPDFTSAGGHLNPGAHQHGTDNPNGSHLGDLSNLVINSTGTGAMSAKLRGSRAEVETALFDGDGTAFVVHASADDYRTDPSGNSGARIACGVLTRP